MLTDPTEVQVKLDEITHDDSLFLMQNVSARADVLEFLGLVEQVVQLRRHDRQWSVALPALKRQSAKLRQRVLAANEDFFQDLQDQIRAGQLAGEALRQTLNQYTTYRPNQSGRRHMGYDGLDLVVNGLIEADYPPDVTTPRDAEMVHLEATPARAILDMVDQVGFTANDVFCDIGSGLGNVALMVRLLTDAIVKGIEYEPAYCQHAQAMAGKLGLTDITFINADARDADYSAGTVFFMFTPFTGDMLSAVLDRLKQEARHRFVRLCSYGTITLDIAQQGWLLVDEAATVDAYSLVVFSSQETQ